MTITVYGHPASTCTRKVLAVLNEKEEKYDLVLVDVMGGGQKAPEHVARQPYGQIPVIDDGDFRLFESRAIIRYLAEKFANKGPELIPKDPKAKAVMEQQISVETSNLTPSAMKLVYQEVFNPMKKLPTDPKLVEEALAALTKTLEVYEKFLSQYKYAGGNTFTLADICNMPYFEYLQGTSAKAVIAKFPHVQAWWDNVSARPAWKKTVGK